MSIGELRTQDDEVAQSAIQALAVASRRARESGRSMVYVENGAVVRIGPMGKTVLNQLPIRRKVTTRVKKAKS